MSMYGFDNYNSLGGDKMNILDLEKNGFILFKSNITEESLDIANKVGKVIHHNDFLSVQTLIPKNRENEQTNTYSGNFGLNEFPLHSDMAHWFKPPKYLLLRCIEEAPNTFTSIIHFENIINELKNNDVDINLAHFVPRRRLNFKTNIIRVSEQNGINRWDSIFMKPYNQKAIVLKELLSKKLNSVEPIRQKLETGECLLINNWKMLHGRSVIDTNSLNRKYERIYISEVYNV